MKEADLCHDNSEYVFVDEYKKLEQQLKEANEVIEFYGSGEFCGKLFKRYPQLGTTARQYLNKCKLKE